MMLEQFQPDLFYRPGDPAMRVIASCGVLAQWRYRSEGPPYFKFGTRVAYKGSDLNAWLAEQFVRPKNGSGASLGVHAAK